MGYLSRLFERFKSALFVLPRIYNNDTGQWDNYDGQPGHSGLITTRGASSIAGTALCVITVGKKGYVTFMGFHGVGAQTVWLSMGLTTIYSRYIIANTPAEITNGGHPIIELPAGQITFYTDAGANEAVVNITYFEK